MICYILCSYDFFQDREKHIKILLYITNVQTVNLSWILRYSSVFSCRNIQILFFCQKLSFHNWLCELKYFSFTWTMRLSVESNLLKYQRVFCYSTNATRKLYTTIVILQFYEEESSRLYHFWFSETYNKIFNKIWTETKYLRKVFETLLNDYIWLAEPGNI